MDLETATVRDIVEELNHRPVSFLLAFYETEPIANGRSGVAHNLPDTQTAIEFCASAARYLHEHKSEDDF
jgi:hypothetical protein